MQFYVKDIMSSDLITINENASIRELVTIFADNCVMGVPVVNEEGFIEGVVSSFDVIKKESSHQFYHAPTMSSLETEKYEDISFFDQPVSSIMTKDLYTAGPDETIAKMAKTMYDKKIHRLLVIEYDKLVGIVSTFDLLKLLATSDETTVV